ncbi:MAG: amidohydrolase family protein [Dehalococcoidia bacterium]
MASSLVRGKYVICKVTGPDSADVVTDGAVYQEDGKIVEVGAYEELKVRHPSVEVIGSPGHVVIPGLVNDHDHVGFSSIQLGVPHAPLELSGLGRIGARQLDPYLEHLHGAIQMLETGTTTVQIMYTPGRGVAPIDPVATDKVIRAYQDAGVRLSYAPNLQDQNSMVASPRGGEEEFAAWLPPDLGRRFSDFIGKSYVPVDEMLGQSEDLFHKYNGGPQSRTIINTAPTNVQRCSDELLMGLKALSVKYNTTTHIHLLETVYQKLFGLRIYGTTALQHLKDIGFLGPDVVCGHSVWVTDEDIEVLRDTQTCVCHNASSNFRLLSGIAPVHRFVEEGIPVAIGTDDMGMNDDKDMLQEMRLVLKIHRLPTVEFNPLTPHQVFQMATVNGAHASGFGDSIGTLEIGKRADMTLIDLKRLDEPYLNPDVSIVDALVHRARGVDVDTTLVDGEVVMRGGRVTRVDKEALFKEIRQALDRPLTRQEQERGELGRELRPHLKRYYTGTLGQMPSPHSSYNART